MATPDELSLFELQVREELARRYDADYLAIHGRWFPEVELSVIQRALRLSPEDVLLDLGCGTGRLTVQFAPLCKQVIAVDRSRASLDVLRERMRDRGIGNISIVEADVSKPSRIERTVTKALSVQLLQHIPERARRRVALRNAFGALHVGGRIVLLDENDGLVRRLRSKPREIVQPDTLFFHPFESEEIRADLMNSGFHIECVGGCGVFYWTHYWFAPRMFATLDSELAFAPGASLIAKFLVSVGTKPMAAEGTR